MWPVSAGSLMRRAAPRFPALIVGPLLALLFAAPVAAHGDVPPSPPDATILLTAWSLDPTIVIPLLATALAWLWAVRRVNRQHPGNPVPTLRIASFLAGLVVIEVALQSGIERYDTTLFSIHMVQHLLLMLVAPPLILLGAPMTVLLRAATPWARRRVILPILHSAPIRFISHPVTAWLAFTGVLWLTHFSPLFDLALDNVAIHDLEHVLFVTSALLFWFPVIGADPAPNRLGYPARLLYLLLQMPPSSFLAMAILFTDHALYPHYEELGSPYGVTALADQGAAASLMWVSSDIVFIGAILLVVGAWMRHEERRAAETERQVDAERAALAERADRLAARTGRYAPDRAVPGRAAGRAPGQAGTGEASSSR